jgi:hypothetical protein
MQFFFDGSEGRDDNGNDWLTLAGFVSSNSFWTSFNRQWDRMLKDRYPIAPYVHMWELIHGSDPFERIVGWTQDRVNQLVNDAIGILQGMDKSAFCSFVCTIDVSARSRLISMGSEIPEPAMICGHWCVGKASQWYFNRHPNKIDLVHVFFDRNEKFISPLKREWLQKRTPPDRVAKELFWDLIADIDEVDMSLHPPIQAADMMAWGRSRSLSARDRTQRNLLAMIQFVVPSWSLVLDERRLREKHPPKMSIGEEIER